MESTLNSKINVNDRDKPSQLPPGFRFHPTDEELVTYYLSKKILDDNFSCSAIAEADFNRSEPWDLPAKAKIGEKEWYFFGHRDRKYPRGLRTNRATEAGYWKTTGKDQVVFSSRSSGRVGIKKTLVFYKGRAPKGEKTNWVMHEYRFEGKFSDHPMTQNYKDEWVVCRIFEKSTAGKKNSIGLLNRKAFHDLPGSPSVPSLLECPCNTTAANDQETASSEGESEASSKGHDMPCFSIPVEGYHPHESQCGGNSNYPDWSDQLSEMQSSYMHNLMLEDPMIHMKMMSSASLFSVYNMRRDQISTILDKQLPGVQPLTPSNPHFPLPSKCSNLESSTDAYFSDLHSSNSVSKELVGQSERCPGEPCSSSFVHQKASSNNNTKGTNNCATSFLWANDGLSQKILAQPIKEVDGAACLSTYISDEMTSVGCNRLDPSLDQLDSGVAPPVDFDSLWNIRNHLF